MVFDTSSLSWNSVVAVGVMFPPYATPGNWFVLDRVEVVARPRPAPVWTKLITHAIQGGAYSVQNPVKSVFPAGVTVKRSRAVYSSGWITCRWGGGLVRLL